MTQTISNKSISDEREIKRECHGRTIAISRMVDKVCEDPDSYFYLVESKSLSETWYFVRYEDSYEWCSCKDYESKSQEV